MQVFLWECGMWFLLTWPALRVKWIVMVQEQMDVQLWSWFEIKWKGLPKTLLENITKICDFLILKSVNNFSHCVNILVKISRRILKFNIMMFTSKVLGSVLVKKSKPKIEWRINRSCYKVFFWFLPPYHCIKYRYLSNGIA